MKQYLFELTKEEIENACMKKEDCMGCEFMYQHGICAKRFSSRGYKPIKRLV